MGRLAGRTAIVTGGARGIGAHYARALAAEGAQIMIADIADGTGLAEEIARRHGANSVASTLADVSDERSVQGLASSAIERFGTIDVLVPTRSRASSASTASASIRWRPASR